MTKAQTATVLKTLAEPNRVAILRLLRGTELPATKIAGQFPTTRSAISQHLRVLKHAGLLHERRAGTQRLYSIRPEGFQGLRELLDMFWDVKIGRLKTEVEREARSKRDR
ncbi:MAG: metalloregulator ArsR/SmtB family transcription factor [Spirochaetia bacterium]